MVLFSLHQGHTPALSHDLLNHLQGLRQHSKQNVHFKATMPKRNCKGSYSSASDTESSQTNSQLPADSSGVRESASDCSSSGSLDDIEISDQRKARSEQGTAAATKLQTQATNSQQAVFQNLDAILSTGASSGMLRRKVEQASPSATCAGARCLCACLVRVKSIL